MLKYLEKLKQQEDGYRDIRFTVRSCREEKDISILFKPDGKYYSPLRVKTRKKYVTVEKSGINRESTRVRMHFFDGKNVAPWQVFKNREEAQVYISQELRDLSQFWLV
jgi:hypothetical protein